MNKGKWIMLGVLMFIPLLIKMLLKNCGIPVTGKAEVYLFLGMTSFFVNPILVPKEYQKYTKWFTILLFLLFISTYF